MTRHRFDPLSFVVGLTALAIAGVALARPETLTITDLRLAGPITLLALGLAALVTATTRGPRSEVEPTPLAVETEEGGSEEGGSEEDGSEDAGATS